MTNYIIEGDFDFYNELYKSLDDEVEQNTQVCLITNMPLTKHFVELDCKHTFNYVPLFKDLVNYKTKFSSLETYRSKINEIRCPYCRRKQSSLLPYIEEISLPKEHGVNWINTDLINTSNVADLKVGKCCWGDGTECHSMHVLTHGITGLDYCYYHYKQTCKKMLAEQKQAKKTEELKKKMEMKEFIKQQKAEAKQKLREEKLIARLAKKALQNKNTIAITDENVVLTGVATCQSLLKSGARKGQPCGGAVKLTGFCMRHGKNMT